MKPLGLTAEERGDLVTFFNSLTGAPLRYLFPSCRSEDQRSMRGEKDFLSGDVATERRSARCMCKQVAYEESLR